MTASFIGSEDHKRLFCESFLETQREDNFASRSASDDEVREFNALLGIGTKVVAVPPKPR